MFGSVFLILRGGLVVDHSVHKNPGGNILHRKKIYNEREILGYGGGDKVKIGGFLMLITQMHFSQQQ